MRSLRSAIPSTGTAGRRVLPHSLQCAPLCLQRVARKRVPGGVLANAVVHPTSTTTTAHSEQTQDSHGRNIDEYDSPYDVGFHREYAEDQFSFITQELELSDEQTAYLLMKLGLLPGSNNEDGQEQEHYGDTIGTIDDDDDEGADEESEPTVHYDHSQPEEMHAAHNDQGRGITAHSSPATSSMDLSVSISPNFAFDMHEVEQETRQSLAAASAKDMQYTRVDQPAASTSAPSTSSSQQQDNKPKGIPRVPYDPQHFENSYEVIQLRVIGRRSSTAAAMGEEIELSPGRIIAGRYQVLEQVGAAAFSRAVQVLDLKDDRLLCLKVVKNDKESLDACLEEIRLLQMVNARDPADKQGIIRMHDYFYYLGHLFLVMELLGGNLYETQRQDPTYFTLPRVQAIAKQALRSLEFLHKQDIIHADIKPENILVKDYKKCSIKVIDLGCSIYRHETRNSHYVQSRSYRAPEVMLGLPYDGRIDVWSLGCVLAEMLTGQVLFPAVADVAVGDEVYTEQITEAAMLARMAGIFGPLPQWMLREGSYAGAFFTKSGQVYERCSETGLFQVLRPKRTSLQARVPMASADRCMLHFISSLLNPDPLKRPTVEQALKHPWLSHKYRSS